MQSDVSRRFWFTSLSACLICLGLAQSLRAQDAFLPKTSRRAPQQQSDKSKPQDSPTTVDPKSDSNEAAIGSGLLPELQKQPGSPAESDPPAAALAKVVEVPESPSADVPMSASEAALRDKISRVLDAYIERPENAAERAPWGAMHGFISYGVDASILVNQQKVNCIAYLAYNNPCRGIRLLEIQNGRPTARVGVNVQGHEGQFLAMLAQSRVAKDYPLKINGQNFTVADLIETEKKTCKSRTELTFKLIALSHYLDLDETWKSDAGESWSLPRLINEELAQPVVGGACGGTHRLMGLSYAARNREKRGGAIEGEWSRAVKFIDDFQAYAFTMQNPSGGFSTEFFAARADDPTPRSQLYTTGHITEWLAYSLPVEQLSESRMEKAVHYLADILLTHYSADLGVGPRGHGLHALVIYEERRFGARPGERVVRLQQKNHSTSR